MTVAVFVSSEPDAASLIPWGVQFACAEHTQLLIVCPRKSKGKRGWDPLETSEKDENPLFRRIYDTLDQQDQSKIVLKQDIAAGTESSDLDRVAVETLELIAPHPEEAFVEEIHKLDVSTLLLPAHEPVRVAKGEEMAWTQQLFNHAPCQVVMLRGTPPECETPLRILVASQDATSSDDLIAISQACRLASSVQSDEESDAGSVTVLYVRPDDDVVARQVAERHLKQLERGVSDKTVSFKKRIELADSFAEGINRQPLEDYDLVMVGTRAPKAIRAVLRDVGQTETGPKVPVSVIRVAVPLTDRFWSRVKDAVRSRVPQLDREHRVSLVDRLQDNSKFNFDFVALISLSTLIAALGLARDSGAVVIGAMLVAPLMTPLVGMGFALVQGNVKLIRNAFKSVVFGFAVALAIGAVLGLFLRIFHFDITQQMLYRGEPNFLDLVIALASGVAGAYAMGRPNLISALPGVAIAAALVPPIATSGLALTMGSPILAGGASLLFFTNIVAIVLGTAITFWAVGISTRVGSEDRPVQAWPRVWFAGFVIVSFLLAILMSMFNLFEMPDESQGIEVQQRKSNIEALGDVDYQPVR